MKINRIILMALLGTGLFYSCDDAINITQDGEKNDSQEIYKSVADLERGVQGVYSSLSTETEIGFASIWTDEVAIGINNGGQGITDGQYTFKLTSASDTPLAVWNGYYLTINFANRVLDAAKDLEDAGVIAPPTADASSPNYNAELNWVYAQLYAIRAFCHLQLETYFSTDLHDNSALGVMIADFVPDDTYSQFRPRVSNQEVFDFINKDFDTAQSLMAASTTPGFIDEGDSVFYMSLDAIYGLRGRMNVYRGLYAEGITYLDKLSATYKVASSRTDFPSIWTDEMQLVDATDPSNVDTKPKTFEVFFELSRVKGDFQIPTFWYSQSTGATGSPFYEVGRGLYNLYASNDIRGSVPVLLDQTSQPQSNYASLNAAQYKQRDLLFINKYPGDSKYKDDRMVNNVKVLRGSEMQLLRAEAQIGLGQLSGAETTIGALMKKRIASTTPNPSFGGDTQKAWQVLLEERRKELAFEGFRYVDIKRLGKLANRGIDRYSKDCDAYNSCTLDPTDHRFVFPIPVAELNGNPQMSGQQNPGY